MFHGVSHIDVAVTDLARARRLYAEGLGFRVVKEGAGFVDLDANTLCLRLFEVRAVEHRVALRLQAPDVQKAWNRLVELGAKPLYQPERTPAQELAGSVADADGHRLSVWRPLSEDEYGYLPELPKEQTWATDADALLRSLLTAVPALFRGLARRKVAREAEQLARGRDVAREDVIRGYIRATAKLTRDRTKVPLRAHGIDPDRYRLDFEAD